MIQTLCTALNIDIELFIGKWVEQRRERLQNLLESPRIVLKDVISLNMNEIPYFLLKKVNISSKTKKCERTKNFSFVLLCTYCRFSYIFEPETNIFLKPHNNLFQ
jgi:hypothetical protein